MILSINLFIIRVNLEINLIKSQPYYPYPQNLESLYAVAKSSCCFRGKFEASNMSNLRLQIKRKRLTLNNNVWLKFIRLNSHKWIFPPLKWCWWIMYFSWQNCQAMYNTCTVNCKSLRPKPIHSVFSCALRNTAINRASPNFL